MSRLALGALAAVVITVALPGSSGAVQPWQLGKARSSFNDGQYAEAAQLIEELEGTGELTEEADFVEAYRIHGLASFYLDRRDEARRSFLELLRADPDYKLPESQVPPSAIEEFERVRAENEADLAKIRTRKAIAAEQKKREEEEQRRKAEEADRRRIRLAQEEALARQPPLLIHHNSIATAFIPFGVPQFERDQQKLGVLLAIGQAGFAAGSILTYSQTKSLIRSDGKVDAADEESARSWRAANWVCFGGLVGLYLTGMIDALVRYEPTTLPDGTPYKPREAPKAAGSAERSGATLFLTPVPGGAAAGVTTRF